MVAKAYADWVTRSPELRGATQFIIDPPALYAAGIEPVYVPTRLPLGSPSAMNTRTTRVKNSVDVKMTADCIECAHSYPNIGTYVLVSGDSDFIHVINSLRAIGKRVIIIGVSWSTSRRLADQVDGLILYDIDVDPEHQPEPEPVPAAADRASRANGGNRQQLSDVMRQIEEIVRSERQAGRTPLLTSLKQRIMRRVPGFDEKKLGFSGFKKLMLRTAEEGTIKLVTVGLVDWVIMADEPDPVEAHTESTSERGSVETVAADEEVVLDDQSQSGPVSETETVAEVDGAAFDAASSATLAAEQRSVPGESETLAAASETLSESDSVTVELPAETEALSDAAESDVTDEVAPPALSPQLVKALEETLSQLELPRGPGDGQDGRRLTDLVIMADMLEHQEGITHVAFNFLLAEVCGALQQGLDAEHPEITSRWGGRTYSRTYVTRLLRELGDKEIFLRDWHQERNEETGRTSRFRTFNLNRSHPLVREALVSQWGPDTDTIDHEPEAILDQAPEAPPEEHSLETETVDESPVPASEVEAEAEEATPPPPARPSRRRGRQSQSAEEESQTVGQVTSEAGTAEAPPEEATPLAAARPSRRRGRQRQAAEEESEAVGQVASESSTEEAPTGESTSSTAARPSRRRGRQRQAAGDTAPTVEQAASGADAEDAQATESQAAETAPAQSPRPSRRRGRQRQSTEESLPSPDGEPGPDVVAVADVSVPDAEPASAEVD